MTTGSARALEVFWRPGCGFCMRLRLDLRMRGIDATWRNIWQDEEARAIVALANDGDEIVPTVRFGEATLTNPSGRAVAELIGS